MLRATLSLSHGVGPALARVARPARRLTTPSLATSPSATTTTSDGEKPFDLFNPVRRPAPGHQRTTD